MLSVILHIRRKSLGPSGPHHVLGPSVDASSAWPLTRTFARSTLSLNPPLTRSVLAHNPLPSSIAPLAALAGSTIMLLTIPWTLALIAGRVVIDANGDAQYKNKANKEIGWSLTRTGVSSAASGNLFHSGILMMITCSGYVIIQIPGIMYSGKDGKDAPFGSTKLSELELPWAIGGSATCFVLLFAYLIFQVLTSNHEALVAEQRKKAIKDGHLSASHIFETIMNTNSDNSTSRGSLQRATSYRPTGAVSRRLSRERMCRKREE